MFLFGTISLDLRRITSPCHLRLSPIYSFLPAIVFFLGPRAPPSCRVLPPFLYGLGANDGDGRRGPLLHTPLLAGRGLITSHLILPFALAVYILLSQVSLWPRRKESEWDLGWVALRRGSTVRIAAIDNGCGESEKMVM